MHSILPFSRIYWNMKGSWFRPLITTLVRAIWFSTFATIRTRWWPLLETTILCWIFPSKLKRVAFDWFYSLTPRSIHGFKNLTKLFLAQYSSCQEFKRNNNHLLFIKMRPSDSLKAYIGYFQNQLVKVHNSEDASVLAFISGLRITHPLYKHLVKYNISCWSKVLYQAQLYIQLEEAMKSSVNSSFNRGDDGIKLKQHESSFVDFWGCG